MKYLELMLEKYEVVFVLEASVDPLSDIYLYAIDICIFLQLSDM